MKGFLYTLTILVLFFSSQSCKNDKTIMENINKRTLGAVGQVIIAVIFNEAMGDF